MTGINDIAQDAGKVLTTLMNTGIKAAILPLSLPPVLLATLTRQIKPPKIGQKIQIPGPPGVKPLTLAIPKLPKIEMEAGEDEELDELEEIEEIEDFEDEELSESEVEQRLEKGEETYEAID